MPPPAVALPTASGTVPGGAEVSVVVRVRVAVPAAEPSRVSVGLSNAAVTPLGRVPAVRSAVPE